MQELRQKIKNDEYWFIYLETKKVIIVVKNDKPTYFIYVQNAHRKQVNCNCPGAKYHGKCKHATLSIEHFNLIKRKIPRLPINKWREDYVNNWWENKQRGKKNGVSF